MAPIPPPPPSRPSAPPPPPMKNSANKGAIPGQSRAALFSDIHKGAKLKKTVTVDKSKPLIESKTSQSITTSSQSGENKQLFSAGPQAPGLGGLFANGMPKLKSRTGNVLLKKEPVVDQMLLQPAKNSMQKPALSRASQPTNNQHKNLTGPKVQVQSQLPKPPALKTPDRKAPVVRPPGVPKIDSRQQNIPVFNTAERKMPVVNPPEAPKVMDASRVQHQTNAAQKPPRKAAPLPPIKTTNLNTTNASAIHTKNNFASKKSIEGPTNIGTWNFITTDRFPLPPKDMLDYKIGPFRYPSGRKSGSSIPFDISRF